MTLPVPQRIAEWHGVDARLFRDEILPQYRPAVMRGLIGEWPAVGAARVSAEHVARYLAALDTRNPVDAILMPPEARGCIAYDAEMNGFNFARRRVPVSSILEQLSRYAVFDLPPSVAVQSAALPDCLPGFAAANRLTLLDDAVVPRIWLGNRITVPAHFDESDNIACVVAGRRRFMLFPPEQVGNLYIGPLDFAPTGAAMSMASLDPPDLERFPRLRTALDAALVAELEPGDALYIPTLWWHHVESLDGVLNVLVNYWWNGSLGDAARRPSGMDCLLHALLNLSPMPAPLRSAWAAMFQHYVFGDDPARFAHIPAHRRGLLGQPATDAAERIRRLLVARLTR